MSVIHTIGLYPHLNKSLCPIFKAAGSAVFGVSIYLPSLKEKETGFSAVSVVSDHNYSNIADFVDRRRLREEKSAAIGFMYRDDPMRFFSKGLQYDESHMFDNHLCAHFSSVSAAPVLQISFDPKVGTLEKREGQIIALGREILSTFSFLSKTYGPDIDDVFQVKQPYSPDMIVVLCDLTGFTGLVGHCGSRFAHKMIKQLHDTVIEPVCVAYGLSLMRPPEGDNFWLGLPVNRGDDIKQIVSEKIRPMITTLQNGFDAFRETHDLEDLKLKIAVSAGEMERDRMGEHIVYNSAAFLTCRQLMQNAPREKNTAIIDRVLT